MQSISLESYFQLYRSWGAAQLSSALQSRREQLGSCIVFYLTDEGQTEKKLVIKKTSCKFIFSQNKCWRCLEWVALDESGPWCPGVCSVPPQLCLQEEDPEDAQGFLWRQELW